MLTLLTTFKFMHIILNLLCLTLILSFKLYSSPSDSKEEHEDMAAIARMLTDSSVQKKH